MVSVDMGVFLCLLSPGLVSRLPEVDLEVLLPGHGRYLRLEGKHAQSVLMEVQCAGRRVCAEEGCDAIMRIKGCVNIVVGF